jgi:hypothetical protein
VRDASPTSANCRDKARGRADRATRGSDNRACRRTDCGTQADRRPSGGGTDSRA